MPERGKVRRDHGYTSQEAADRAAAFAGTQRAYVESLFVDEYPRALCDLQVQQILGMNPSSERPRRLELEERGHIRRTGEILMAGSRRETFIWVPLDDRVEMDTSKVKSKKGMSEAIALLRSQLDGRIDLLDKLRAFLESAPPGTVTRQAILDIIGEE